MRQSWYLIQVDLEASLQINKTDSTIDSYYCVLLGKHPNDMKKGTTVPDHVRDSIYKHTAKFAKESVTEAVVDFDSPGMMFKVSVEGLPDMFMAGRGPSDIKAQLRKIVKQPSMIQSVKRMPKTAVKKMFRDIFQGREEEE